MWPLPDRNVHGLCFLVRFDGSGAGWSDKRRRRREGPVRQGADRDLEGIARLQAGFAARHQTGIADAREQPHPGPETDVGEVFMTGLSTEACPEPDAFRCEQGQQDPPAHLHVEPPVLKVENPRDRVGPAVARLHDLPQLERHPARLGESPRRRDVGDRSPDQGRGVHAGPDDLGQDAVPLRDRGPSAEQPLTGAQVHRSG